MSDFGFDYGRLDDGRIWLRNDERRYVAIEPELLDTLLAASKGKELVEEADRQAVERLRDDGFLHDGDVVEHRPSDIVLWPRVLLFLAALGSLAVIVALRFDVAWPPPSDPLVNLWAVPFFVFAATLHELGHWAAARRWFDARIGFGLLNGFFPAFVTKTNDAWACPRNARIWINLAGPFVDVCLTLLVALVHLVWLSEVDVLSTLILVQFMRILFVFNPLIEGDGYWCLSDLFGIVNLRTRGLRDLKSLRPTPYAAYALASVAFTAFVVVFYAVVLTRFVTDG